MYDFAKTNLPVRLFETIPIMDELEVDMYVKRYMRSYGIENVRGGNFINEYLPSTVISSIESEINKDYYEIPTLIETICRKYESIQHWRLADVKQWRTWRREYEFMDQPNNIKDVMKLEKYYLKRDWTLYEEKKHMFQSLTYCSPDINLDLIDFTQEIEWFKMQIIPESTELTEIWSNKEDALRYTVLLQLFEFLKQKFLLIHDELPHYERECFIHTPVLIFDTFIYHRYDTNKMEKERKVALEVFYIFEYMFNCVMNRIEDYRFSLKQYPQDYENQVKYTIEYIDYTYFSDTM